MQYSPMRSLLAATAFVCLSAGAAAAQSGESQEIVVTAPGAEQARRFVDQVTAVPATVDQLPRWDRAICTSVAGLPARQAQFIADRVAARAHALGLQPGAPGCRANVSIIVTSDANGLARRMYEQEPQSFAVLQENNVATRGRAAFDEFLTSARPVRWWHVAEAVSADGLALSGDAANGGISNAPVARSSGSRLREDIRLDLSKAIIIVDARRVGNVQLAALSDYIAMVALAQLNPGADTTVYPSILNVFTTGADHPPALTAWDVAFLDALYRSTRNATSVEQQQREISRRMVERS